MRKTDKPRRREATPSDFVEKVVCINRVSKVVKGGRRFSFSAMVVIGNRKGKVGAGLGKASEVPEAIRKAIEEAKKNLIEVPIWGTTLPHEIIGHFGASRIMLKPVPRGVGLIAGGAMRHVLYVAGVADVIAKSMGSNNPINAVRATLQGLGALKSPKRVARLRGKSVAEFFDLPTPSAQQS